jgi:hypothetical protein
MCPYLGFLDVRITLPKSSGIILTTVFILHIFDYKSDKPLTESY